MDGFQKIPEASGIHCKVLCVRHFPAEMHPASRQAPVPSHTTVPAPRLAGAGTGAGGCSAVLQAHHGHPNSGQGAGVGARASGRPGRVSATEPQPLPQGDYFKA